MIPSAKPRAAGAPEDQGRDRGHAERQREGECGEPRDQYRLAQTMR
jgi:hypothetical protein